MATGYRLIKRRNPQDPEGIKKWYAVPNSMPALSTYEMSVMATENTTITPMEMESSLRLLARFIPQQIKQGHTVHIPGLGYFRLSFSSDGVEDIKDFDAGHMIKRPRLIFVPDKQFRDSVLNGLKFIDLGVLDEDIEYASRNAYMKAKGLLVEEPEETIG